MGAHYYTGGSDARQSGCISHRTWRNISITLIDGRTACFNSTWISTCPRCKFLPQMKPTINRRTTLPGSVLGTIAVVLSVASAFSYFNQFAQGFVVGDLLGLPGREGDVALAQHRATHWLIACIVCLAGSIIATALALPFFADASRLGRLIARFVVASICSLALTLLIGVVVFTIMTTLHHSVVR
jgi:hypothetical protein